jgi:GNAT superfamily N-acetyltransferase
VTNWHEATIGKSHNLEAFDCDNDELNNFLTRHARRSHEWGGLKTFLAIANRDDRTVMGFYSLGAVSLEVIKPNVAPWGPSKLKQLGFRLEYLAVDRNFQRQGVGGQLLLAAGRRCLTASVKPGGNLLLIAATHKASTWFAGYGAVPLLDATRFHVLPLSLIEAALQEARRSRGKDRESLEPDF